MPRQKWFLLLLMAASPALAQQSSLQPTCLLDGASTTVTVSVTNNDSRIVHAWTVNVSLFEVGGAIRQLERSRDDVLFAVNPLRWKRVLLPGQTDSRQIRLAGKTLSCSAEITLATFSDGTYVGDSRSLDTLLSRRRERALEAGRLLAASNVPIAGVAQALTAATASKQNPVSQYVVQKLASIATVQDPAAIETQLNNLRNDLLDYASLSHHLQRPKAQGDR